MATSSAKLSLTKRRKRLGISKGQKSSESSRNDSEDVVIKESVVAKEEMAGRSSRKRIKSDDVSPSKRLTNWDEREVKVIFDMMKLDQNVLEGNHGGPNQPEFSREAKDRAWKDVCCQVNA